MLKKTMAILLSMALLLTLCPMTGVFAALPEYSKMDDFEDEAVRSGFSKFPNPNYTTDPQDSDVFVTDTETLSSGLAIVEDSTIGKVMQAS